MKAIAILKKYSSSPRKARLVADIVRGQCVKKAVYILRNDTRKVSYVFGKLLNSCISNWKQKNKSEDLPDDLTISEIRVDQGGMLKRIKPAPQGRAHRIRKRFCHISIVIDTLNTEASQNTVQSKIKSKQTIKQKTKIISVNKKPDQNLNQQKKSTSVVVNQEMKDGNSIIEKLHQPTKTIPVDEKKHRISKDQKQKNIDNQNKEN